MIMCHNPEQIRFVNSRATEELGLKSQIKYVGFKPITITKPAKYIYSFIHEWQLQLQSYNSALRLNTFIEK